jgi:hypothetical protein
MFGLVVRNAIFRRGMEGQDADSPQDVIRDKIHEGLANCQMNQSVAAFETSEILGYVDVDLQTLPRCVTQREHMSTRSAATARIAASAEIAWLLSNSQ